MSVLIKGMSKPEKCLDCPMCNSNDDCILQDKICLDWEEQMKGCPIIDVPNTNVGNNSEIPNSSGTISRQAVIDWASKIPIHDLSDGRGLCRVIFAEDFLKALKQLPSAEHTAHWIEIGENAHTYKCSECGRLLVNITDGKNHVYEHYPYCHCGAYMKGGE